MAHRPEVKAYALALLLTGNSVGYTAQATGVPKQTVSRWNKLAGRILNAALRARLHPDDYDFLCRWGRELRLLRQNGTKKRR